MKRAAADGRFLPGQDRRVWKLLGISVALIALIPLVAWLDERLGLPNVIVVPLVVLLPVASMVVLFGGLLASPAGLVDADGVWTRRWFRTQYVVADKIDEVLVSPSAHRRMAGSDEWAIHVVRSDGTWAWITSVDSRGVAEETARRLAEPMGKPVRIGPGIDPDPERDPS